MPHQELSTFRKRATILIGLGVVSAMSFGLSISFYRNLLFEETLEALSERNRELRQDIDQELDELAYYASAQYKDKYAKENLGRLNAGEQVLILQEQPQPRFARVEAGLTQSEREAAYKQFLLQIPIIEHWRLYLFEPQQLKELKRSF